MPAAHHCASGARVFYASPQAWNRVCARQGSWYRDSDRAGQYMLVSAERLPPEHDAWLDAEMRLSDFDPDHLPTERELAKQQT